MGCQQIAVNASLSSPFGDSLVSWCRNYSFASMRKMQIDSSVLFQTLQIEQLTCGAYNMLSFNSWFLVKLWVIQIFIPFKNTKLHENTHTIFDPEAAWWSSTKCTTKWQLLDWLSVWKVQQTTKSNSYIDKNIASKKTCP